MDLDTTKTQVLSDTQISLSRSIIAIGAFDGVHRGHQALISAAVNEARTAKVPSVVWTFDPPPKVVFGRVPQLCSLEEKLARITRLGTDYIVVASFNRHYAAKSAKSFLDDLGKCNPSSIHVGQDFRFGHKQSGDVGDLAACFNVNIATPVNCDAGEPVSSTRIRALRAAGRQNEADSLQGAFDKVSQFTGRLLTEDLRFKETTQ